MSNRPFAKRHRFTLLACALLIAAWVQAAPGELDFTFGGGGKVIADIGGGNDNARSVAVQSDGKILVAGVASGVGGGDFALARYNTDGSLDSSFGGTGKVNTPIGSGLDFGEDVVVQGDGKIVVAGYSFNGSDTDFALVRYTSTGALDTSFGGGGKVTTAIGNSSDSACGVAVQSNGKIVVAGTVQSSGGAVADFAVVRYNPDGSLDTTFNGTGKVVTDLGTPGDEGRKVALQSDGKIVVAGKVSLGDGTSDFAVVRYQSNGNLDTGFNSTGKVTADFGSGLDICYGVAVQNDGKILLAGASYHGPAGQSVASVAMFRCNADGSFDASFGSSGKITTAFPKSGGFGSAYATDVVVQTDGKIVLSGIFADALGVKPLVARYHPDGSMDTSFNGAGAAIIDLEAVELSALALQGDGRIVMATPARNEAGSLDFGVVRFYGGDIPVQPAEPVRDTTSSVTGEPDGTLFVNFGTPVIDGGLVGGGAIIKGGESRPQAVVYGGDGSVQARVGGTDLAGAEFLALGDPAFGGEALGFAATVRQMPPSMALPSFGAPLASERIFVVRPGGKLAALYSQLTRAGGAKRLAAKADPAPGGGQFASFGAFGLPRARGGLIFTGKLHRSSEVTAKNDFGVWREKTSGGESELLLRHGNPVSTTDSRVVKKLALMTPVAGATDQRRSFAPDGGVAAMVTFADGSRGVVRVAADGSVDVPLDSSGEVRDETGIVDSGAVFTAFTPPATASSGRIALLANLRAAARGLTPPPSQAIFSNLGGTMRRVMARGDAVPGRSGVKFGTLGQPSLGQQGMIGFIAALTGRRVTPANRKAIALNDGGVRAIVARLGDPAIGYGAKTVYRRFLSMAVTDSAPARLLFTATVGGGGVKVGDNAGLWSVSGATGSNLILRKGSTIMVGGQSLQVRTFETLQAPKKNVGQGRSADASGFVTAKVKLSDGRSGVLRIPLP